MKTLVIGKGQVGHGLGRVLSDAYEVITYDLVMGDKYLKDIEGLHTDIELLIIAFPWSDKFIDSVKEYEHKFCPKYTVVVSTVPVGTCEKLDAWHSPISGKHPNLGESIAIHTRWIGGPYNEDLARYFKKANMRPEWTETARETEFLKLASTTLYAVNIEFARYMKEVCDLEGFDYENSKLWNQDYNELYMKLGLPQFQKFVLNAPEGKIGGHCIVSNANILQEQYPNPLVKVVVDNNK